MESVAAENTSAHPELAAAACWQAGAAQSPAPCSQPFVLVSYQPWHEGVLGVSGVSLVYW